MNKRKSSTSSLVKRWPQVRCALVAGLGTFGGGTCLAWSAPALPYIQRDMCFPRPGCDIDDVTVDEGSWLVALLPMGAIASGVVCGALLSRVGSRRWTMAACSVPYLIGFALFVAAHELDSLGCIYAGRLLTGFSTGSFFLVAPIYVVETSEAHLRGLLSALTMTMPAVGLAFVNGLSIEDAVHWNAISAILIAVPVLTLIGLCFVPESPVYLASAGRDADAFASLRALRGPDHDCRGELDGIKSVLADELRAGNVSVHALVTKARYAAPLAVVLVLMVLQQFCGVNVVNFYAQVIFEEAGTTVDPGLSGFSVSVSQVAGNVAAILLVERVGRRALVLASAAVMAVSLFSLGTFFYMKDNQEVVCPENDTTMFCEPQSGAFSEETVDNLSWLPLASLVVFMLGFSIGIGPLAFPINAEMHLPESSSLSSSVAGTFSWTCAFLVTFFEADLEEAVGVYGAYFIYASVCVAVGALLLVVLPETKGKTPQEIGRKWNRSDKKMDR